MYDGEVIVLQEFTLGRFTITSGTILYVCESGNYKGSYYYHHRDKASSIWGNNIEPKIFRDLYNKGIIKLIENV